MPLDSRLRGNDGYNACTNSKSEIQNPKSKHQLCLQQEARPLMLPGFFAPLMSLLALMALPIVVFYFLKLRRQRLEVSSLVLWQQVLSDSRVNAPFQKFKRNLLLLLQLLMLAMLVLAAMQPYWKSDAERAQRVPILIDCSASMAAMDRPGGQLRLDAAKAQINEIIDGLLSDQQISLIAFSDTAQRLCAFTNNKRELKAALEQVKIREVPGDLEDAMRMADAMARAEPFEQVVLFSDGNFPAKTDFALPFNIDYQQLKSPGVNMGIATLNAQRADSRQWDVFVKLVAANAPGNATVQVYQNDQLVGTEDVHVDQEGPKKLVFRLTADEASHVTIKLLPDSFDALLSDNVAYVDLPGLRPLAVNIDKPMVPEQLAIKAMDNVMLVSVNSPADLYLTNEPDAVVDNVKVIWRNGALPQELTQLMDIKKDAGSDVVSWNRADPLLGHITLNDIIVLDQPTLKENVRELDFESLGYRILIHGSKGPLLLTKQYDSHVEYILTVDAARTTLPYRVAFPVILSNLVRQAMHHAGLQEVQAHHTGVFPPMEVIGEKSYTWQYPSGQTQRVTSNVRGKLIGLACPSTGEYSLKDGGDTVLSLGASLLNSDESSLQSVEQLQFRELSITAAAKPIAMDRSFWPTLLWIALAILIFEWWYFHRQRQRTMQTAGQKRRTPSQSLSVR